MLAAITSKFRAGCCTELRITFILPFISPRKLWLRLAILRGGVRWGIFSVLCLRGFIRSGGWSITLRGLLFLTNDGELANKIIRTHGLRQTYLLKVKGNLSDSEIGKVAAVTRVRIERGQRGENPWYEVTMADASRDPLRQELLQMGHPVEKMKRVKIGTLEIGDLAPGRFRSLTLKEVTALESAVKKAAAQPQSAASASRPAGRPRRRILSRGRKPG